MANQPSKFRRRQVFERDHFECLYCGRQVRHLEQEVGEAMPDDTATVDHIMPGDDHCIENLATSCRACNHDKGDKLLLVHPLTGEKIEGVTWLNIWMGPYAEELFEFQVSLMTPRDLVRRLKGRGKR